MQMATVFASSANRHLWSGIGFAFATDACAAALIAYIFFDKSDWMGVAVFAFGAMIAFQFVYGLWAFGRRILWFNLGEKRQRVETIKADARARNVPAPDSYFNNAEHFLNQIVEDKGAPDDARIWCAAMIGAIAAQRAMSRTECMLTLVAVEQALTEYAREESPGGGFFSLAAGQ